MSICVSMHSRTTWPSRINFEVFQCYLLGYIVDEAVEYLISVHGQDGKSKTCSTNSLSVSISSLAPSLPQSHASLKEGPLIEEVGESKGPELKSVEEKTDSTFPSHLGHGSAKIEAPKKGAVCIASIAGEAPRDVDGTLPSVTETGTEAAQAAMLDSAGPKILGHQQVAREGTKKKNRPRHERHSHGHHPHYLPNQQHRGSAKHRILHANCVHGSDGTCKRYDAKVDDWLLSSHEQGFPSLAALVVAAGYAQNQSLSESRGLPQKKKAHHKHRHAHGGHAEIPHHQKYFGNSISSEMPLRVGLSYNVYFSYEDYLKHLFMLEQENALDPARGDKPFTSVETTLLAQLLLEEVREQYDFYNFLTKQMEYALSAPYAFLFSNYLPIPVSDRCKLVELYYTVDPVVFRYYFGTKAVKFEPITGTEEDRKGRGLLQKGSPNENKPSDQMMAYLAQISPVSLQRQWENIQRVSTTLVEMYYGKNNVVIPLEVSLHSAIKRCFGVSEKLALHYNVAVFGYYHSLRTRMLDRLNTYDDVCALCNILTSMWCDDSLLFLDYTFTMGMNRLATLLEEHRVLAELHQLIFSEPMRTRWQVQLDEVQRAMMPNSTGERGAASSALNSMISSTYGATSESKKGKSGFPNFPESTAQGYSSPVSSPYGAAESLLQSSTLNHSLYCNRKVSRRFVLEFPHLMRNLSRMALSIGANRNLSDALEVFYQRIFCYLELLGSRSGQETVSLVLSTAAASKNGAVHTLQPQQQQQQQIVARELGPGHSSMRAQSAERARRPPKEGVAKGAAGSPRSFEGRRAERDTVTEPPAPTARLPKSMSTPSFGMGYVSPTRSPRWRRQNSLEEFDLNARTRDEKRLARELSPLSLRQSTLLTSTRLSASMPPKLQPSQEVTVGNVSDDGTLKTGETLNEAQRRAGMDLGLNNGGPGDAVNNTYAPDASTFEEVMLKAIDKHHLRELLVFLSELPDAWRKLSSVTADDHAECDEALNSFLMALKVITQILMAAEDFR